MSPETLTNAEATALFAAGQAICEGTWILTTRTAEYDWNPTTQRYERIMDGLQVRHRAGVRWATGAQRFVTCHCQWCDEHQAEAEEVDIVNA